MKHIFSDSYVKKHRWFGEIDGCISNKSFFFVVAKTMARNSQLFWERYNICLSSRSFWVIPKTLIGTWICKIGRQKSFIFKKFSLWHLDAPFSKYLKNLILSGCKKYLVIWKNYKNELIEKKPSREKKAIFVASKTLKMTFLYEIPNVLWWKSGMNSDFGFWCTSSWKPEMQGKRAKIH